jgi:8-oxo-dGTP diphosphatase
MASNERTAASRPDRLCAGGVVWRGDGRARRLAVVHRPAYDDWSLPKGHLDPGETFLDAAVREVREETGCTARPIELLTATTYPVGDRQKYVLWWSMAFEAEVHGPAEGEISEVRWLTVAEATRSLSYESEREVLRLANHRAPGSPGARR